MRSDEKGIPLASITITEQYSDYRDAISHDYDVAI